jgi:hypothetical protein
MNKFILLAAALLLHPAAIAKPKKLCPAPDAIVDEIYNCGHNVVAVSYAQACAEAQVAASRMRGAALAAVMQEMQNGQSQSANMTEAQKRLAVAVNELGSQITTLQKNTELVAGYTAPMIDFKDGKNDKTSLECFSKSFHALQKIVTGLDNEIVRSKRARTSALTMLKTLAGRTSHLGSVAGQGLAVKSGSRGPASVPVDPGPRGLNVRPPDITGTEKVKDRP